MTRRTSCCLPAVSLWERRAYWDWRQKYGQWAEIPKAKRCLHALRHAITVHLLDTGVNVAFAQALGITIPPTLPSRPMKCCARLLSGAREHPLFRHCVRRGS
jgi:hypothetical protein